MKKILNSKTRLSPPKAFETPVLLPSGVKGSRLLPASIAAAAALLLLTGCQVLTYSGPNGERFSRSSIGATTSVSSLTVETGTNGLRRVALQGYQNDSSQALGAVTEAAVRAAIQGVK